MKGVFHFNLQFLSNSMIWSNKVL